MVHGELAGWFGVLPRFARAPVQLRIQGFLSPPSRGGVKHDGSRHHGVGIAPTVPVEPTVAGIAAGHDEVPAMAIAVLQQQLDSK